MIKPPLLAVNLGVVVFAQTFKLGLKWNYIPEDTAALTSIGVGGVTVNQSKLTMDLDSEFRFTPRLALFFNARNFLNVTNRQYRYTPLTPEYSRASSVSNGGAKMSAGFKGTF